jgi:hypothetical protein
VKHTPPHSCNVLEVGPDSRQLWQFSVGGGKVSLNSEQRLPLNAPLPLRTVGRGWSSIWQKKLNIAWLPGEHVFLRVARFPACDRRELLSMVELQLEKLSPLPLNQIVWTVETLPLASGDLQTVIVIVVERKVVEEFLGRLEGAGYLADCLELPVLHQLISSRLEGDGVRVFLNSHESHVSCLVAWLFDGALQSLTLLALPAGEAGPALLCDGIARVAWAGEFEGWLTSKPRIHIAADAEILPRFQSALSDWSGDEVEVHASATLPALAEFSASRSLKAEPSANLLPSEFAARYRQQFIDRLWMRGMGGLIVAYLAGVLIYLVALQFRKHEKTRVEREVAALSHAYTNALQLKAKARLLQEQANLRFAALDCLKAVSELLPGDLTLKSFHLTGGKKLTLLGEAPVDQSARVTEFNSLLGATTIHGAPLFARVNPPEINTRAGATASWRFECELRTPDSR